MAEADTNVDLGKLEEPCDACQGEGRSRGRNGMSQCNICNGAGTIPTVTGARILNLIRNNFRSMLNDATEGDY